MHALLFSQFRSLLRCQLHGQRREQEADNGAYHLLETCMCRYAVRFIDFDSLTKALLPFDTLAERGRRHTLCLVLLILTEMLSYASFFDLFLNR